MKFTEMMNLDINETIINTEDGSEEIFLFYDPVNDNAGVQCHDRVQRYSLNDFCEKYSTKHKEK